MSLYSLSQNKLVTLRSETAGLIEDGVADLQCRSDKYLATIVLEEYREGISQK